MKDSNISKYYKTLSIFLFLYLSLVFGFYIDENLNFGAIGDWLHTDKPVIEALSADIKKTLLTYESFGHRHSPLYLIFLSFFHKLGLSLDLIRFLHLNLSIFLVYYFLIVNKKRSDFILKQLIDSYVNRMHKNQDFQLFIGHSCLFSDASR